MTIEEIKELAMSKLPSSWEIEGIFENTTDYVVHFKARWPVDTGVPIIRISKKTKRVQFILWYMLPKDLTQIA